jgi:hypothetical protein
VNSAKKGIFLRAATTTHCIFIGVRTRVYRNDIDQHFAKRKADIRAGQALYRCPLSAKVRARLHGYGRVSIRLFINRRKNGNGDSNYQ